MQITISFRGPLINTLNMSKISLDLNPTATLRGALELLIQRYPAIKTIWSTPEDIDRGALILCNEIDAALRGGLDMRLDEGDAVTILSLIHGG